MSPTSHKAPILKLNLSPEERLLVICARLSLTEEQREELNTLLAGTNGRSPLQWDQVVYKAQWHDLAPLVYHHLRHLDNRNCIPAEAADQLKASYLANVARNLFFQAELRRALVALREQGVAVVLLKGAALANIVYGDSGLRPMSDLDLLVPEAQVYLAQGIVQGLGYCPVGSPEEQDNTEKHHRHLPGLARQGTPVLFEIHRHIVRQDSALHFDISGFWSRAQEVSIPPASLAQSGGREGIRTLALAPEDLLIHLALNFFLDRRFRSVVALRQLCDIAESMRYYQASIRWQLFTENVLQYRLAGPVGCALHLAQVLLGAQVPPEVAHQLWPRGFEGAQVERFLRRRVLDTRTWVARGLATPGSDYRPTGVAVAALRRLIPSRRYLAYRYHTPVSGARGYLLYFARICEGLGIFFRSAARPHDTTEDLAIDRWQHSLYEHRKNGTARGS